MLAGIKGVPGFARRLRRLDPRLLAACIGVYRRRGGLKYHSRDIGDTSGGPSDLVRRCPLLLLASEPGLIGGRRCCSARALCRRSTVRELPVHGYVMGMTRSLSAKRRFLASVRGSTS